MQSSEATWLSKLPEAQAVAYKPLPHGDYSSMSVKQFRDEGYAVYKRGEALKTILRTRDTQELERRAVAYGETYEDPRYKALSEEFERPLSQRPQPLFLTARGADAKQQHFPKLVQEDLHRNAEERWAHESRRWEVEGRAVRDPATPLGERHKLLEDQVRELKNFEEELTQAINSAAFTYREPSHKEAAANRLKSAMKTASRVLGDGARVSLPPEAYRDLLRRRREEAEAVQATLPPLTETNRLTTGH